MKDTMFYHDSSRDSGADMSATLGRNDCSSGLASMLVDYYEINMVYAFWVNGKHEDHAVFEAFFRKCPFGGEFCIFAGLADCIGLLKEFAYGEDDIRWLRNALPENVKPEFFQYLSSVKMDDVDLYAIAEGTPVFPQIPLLRVCGPLGKVQLLETALLNAISYASLVATNAARYRLAASKDIKLSEFGARKAHGPNGALSASRYSYLGGFDSTSNVLAARLYGIPLAGTLAHSFVMSYDDLDELKSTVLRNGDKEIDLRGEAERRFHELCESIDMFSNARANRGELASFIAFALAYPASFVAVVDTYNVLLSGLPNFCAVALCLISLGYRPVGVRLDSGDLVYLAKAVRAAFDQCSRAYAWAAEAFNSMSIIVSNDLKEETIQALRTNMNGPNGRCIGACGVGTHLVTCYKQPSLGVVFKLVEVNNRPVFKVSEEAEKMSIPGSKSLYRLYGQDGIAICDVMTCPFEQPPAIQKKLFVRHPFTFSKRATVTPSNVENLQRLYWSKGESCAKLPSLSESRQHCLRSIQTIRDDHTRLINPRPYKVSLSSMLFSQAQKLWDKVIPVTALN